MITNWDIHNCLQYMSYIISQIKYLLIISRKQVCPLIMLSINTLKPTRSLDALLDSSMHTRPFSNGTAWPGSRDGSNATGPTSAERGRRRRTRVRRGWEGEQSGVAAHSNGTRGIGERETNLRIARFTPICAQGKTYRR